MSNNPKNSRTWVVPFLFLFGGFFLLLTLQEGCYQRSIKLTGVVTEKHYSPGSSRVGSGTLSSRSQHSIKYRFTTPQGEAKEAWCDVLTQNWSKLRLGDPVNIEYLPATKDSRIAGQTASAPVFFFIAMALLTAGAVLRSRQKIIIFLISMLFCPLTLAAAEEPAQCGGEDIVGCPCGKMPVCVISDHEDGFFSQTFFDQATHSSWEGFGQGEISDFGKAMTIEMEMAAALAKTAPCVELVVLNSYHTASMVVETLAEQSGLTQRIQEALAAGDSERLKELYAELDKLFEKFGIQDLPWRNPDLAKDHLQQRLLSCATAKVELTGRSDANGFTISAETSSSIAEMPGQTSSAASSAPTGGIEDLAKKVAGELALIQQKLFCTCEEVLERCNVTNFDLANQESECFRVKTCCGEVIKEGPEKVKGLSFGETRKHEPKCCSPIARSRAGEQVGEEDEDDRRVMNEIWCPGTWNLRGPDLDCDGIPNAKDETPWPLGEGPPGEKP